ncbi:M48 family metalloprotease [Capilliphycus salinus ALCB114379]|uniref:M48 family metalloprotease n=1 Tax=Capilliphycus salinus TaxID=2768948 RepID=UPI0039A5E07A
MSSTPRPPASGSENFPEENPSLETGLAALKQKQYQTAIAHLEAIAESQSHRSAGIKAQMGLVVACERTGNPQKAIAICQSLTQHPKAKVQTWAKNTLEDLKNRYPLETEAEANPKNTTSPSKEPGFVPFEPTLQPPNVQPSQPSKDAGFVAFEPPQKKPSVDAELNYYRLEKPQNHLSSVQQQKENQQQPQPEKISNLPINSSPFSTENSVQTEEILENPQPTEVHPFAWKQAERATQWRRLKALKLNRFYLEQALTVFALLWFLPRLIEFLMETANKLLLWLPLVDTLQLFYRDPTEFVYISLAGLFILSPWLLDGLLKLAYGMQPLAMTTLFNHSPEANRILRNYCQQRNWKIPALRILPTNAPIAMTYGCWPRFARIVVSQGLLDQLSEDEIAVIYAREIASVGQWDFLVMSWLIMIVQIPYQIYWQSAQWVEQSLDLMNRLPEFIPNFVRSILLLTIRLLNIIFTIVSPLSYGLYRILRLPTYWVSRRRVYYHDRTACNLTGNPNGLTRALVKIAMGMASEIQQRGTSSLLEGFDLLMPVSYKQATIFSGVADCGKIEFRLSWDLTNQDRKWLEINNTHPVLGDRLSILSHYASFWKLNTELDLSQENTRSPSPLFKQSRRLLLQGAPYFGFPAGLMLGSLIWLLGGILATVGIWQLEWLFGDFWILAGCIPLACSVGIFIRINSFFPDFQPAKALQNPNLVNLLANPNALPIDSQPLRLEGKLLGRQGLSNLMGQDLILQTATGAIKLHYIPVLTPLANFRPSTHPVDLIGKSITVTGWYRRGATTWIDVETIATQDRQVNLTAGHPIWSTILACALAVWGAYMISQGGF